jgi:hypothetical protein
MSLLVTFRVFLVSDLLLRTWSPALLRMKKTSQEIPIRPNYRATNNQGEWLLMKAKIIKMSEIRERAGERGAVKMRLNRRKRRQKKEKEVRKSKRKGQEINQSDYKIRNLSYEPNKNL